MPSMPGLLLRPLTFNNPWERPSNPLCMHLPAGGCWRAQVDGGAWLLLFPMATAQLCMEADECGLSLRAQPHILHGSLLGPSASHHCPSAS